MRCKLANKARRGSKLFVRLIQTIVLFLAIFQLQCSEKPDIQLPEDEWSFLVFGDIRMGYGVYSKLTQGMSSVTPSPLLAVCGGDVMNHGSNEVEWTAFWEYSRAITDKMPLYITRGNHEGNSAGDEHIFSQQLKSAADKFYFSFKVKNAYFIILDTEIRGEAKGIYNEQLEWLKSELEKSNNDKTIDHVFLSLHRPLWPKGGHEGEVMPNATELHELFLENHKIQIVFVSHDHIFNKYDRDGISYITSGGAGGPLHRGKGGDYHHFVLVSINQDLNSIKLKTIGIFNETVEEFTF